MINSLTIRRYKILVTQSMGSRIDQCQEYEIEILSERLGSLKIIEDTSEKTTEYIDKMLTVLANIQNE